LMGCSWMCYVSWMVLIMMMMMMMMMMMRCEEMRLR
jgi:hypothetical protein